MKCALGLGVVEEVGKIDESRTVCFSGEPKRVRISTDCPKQLADIAKSRGIKYSYALCVGIRTLIGESNSPPEIEVLRKKIERMSFVIDFMRERLELQGQEMVSIRNRI